MDCNRLVQLEISYKANFEAYILYKSFIRDILNYCIQNLLESWIIWLCLFSDTEISDTFNSKITVTAINYRDLLVNGRN